MKRLLFVFIGFFWISLAFSQKDQGIQWISWAQLEKNLREEPKPVFIFFHAEWCAYCKKIEREIFTNPSVIEKINNTYYAIEMDVETQDTILFDSVTFTNAASLKKRNGVHQLPLALASRNDVPFTLPATIILNENFLITRRIFSYYSSKELLKILKRM